jgi:hypothetical protein
MNPEEIKEFKRLDKESKENAAAKRKEETLRKAEETKAVYLQAKTRQSERMNNNTVN